VDSFCSSRVTKRVIAPNFNPVKSVVTICIAMFNNHIFYVLRTQWSYVFFLDLRTNSDYSSIQH